MSQEYGDLAKLYDLFMEEVDYAAWAKKMLHLAGMNSNRGKMLELGCGTGNLTLEFLKAGHQVIALDISEEMLTEAAKKMGKYRTNLRLVCQDMRSMEVGKGFDACLCGCDGFNYILDEKELLKVFKTCYGALKSGGVFVFDVSSVWKLENILGNSAFREERSGCDILWLNRYDPAQHVVEMDLTFLVPECEDEDGNPLYRRFDEVHLQRGYSVVELEKMLAYEGFVDIEFFGDDGLSPIRERDERIFVRCRRE